MDKNIKLPSSELEPLILAYSRMNPNFFLKIKPYLDTRKSRNKNYFNDEKYQIIFNIISFIFDRRKKFPDSTSIKISIDKLKKDKELTILLKSVVDEMFKKDVEIFDTDFLEEEVLNFIKEAKVYEAILESQVDIENGNFDTIVKRMEDSIMINFDKDLGSDLMNIDSMLDKIKKAGEEYCISSGFPNIDVLLDGGFHPKEIYCIAGIPGGGKTLFLGNVALKCFLDGKNVLVYTFETSTERLMMRYFSNLSEMTKKQILESEETFKKRIKGIKDIKDVGRLIIKEFNANSVSSNDILAHINDLEMYERFKPDIVFVDYLLIMKTNDKTLSSDSSYKYYKTVTEELRNIGKSLYIPIITACQINREGMADHGGTKPMITSKNISESRGIFDTVDVFLIIVQTTGDLANNKFRILFNKNRNERTGLRVGFKVKYEYMKIEEENLIGDKKNGNV
jgi:replicative DNA helicase